MNSKAEFIANAEALCFRNPWKSADAENLLNREECVCHVEEPFGYAVGELMYESADLYRLAVLPEYRRQGAGQRLLSAFIAECRERGATSIFLEVRSKNLPAIALYEKNGFKQLHKRKNYYPDDDALIYCLSI